MSAIKLRTDVWLGCLVGLDGLMGEGLVHLEGVGVEGLVLKGLAIPREVGVLLGDGS